jgi:hypothetical protein
MIFWDMLHTLLEITDALEECITSSLFDLEDGVV